MGPLLSVLPWLCSGCGEDGATSETGEAGHTAGELETLRAIGYADWDEAGDQQVGGVTVHDPARTIAGLHLHTNEKDEVWLVDMGGELRHTWRVPGRTQCVYAELLEGGELLVVSEGEGLTRVDWDSQLVWAVDMVAHHDVAPLADGNFLVLDWQEDPDYRGRCVRFDRLVRVTPAGETAVLWDARARREDLVRYHSPLALDTASPGTSGGTTVYDYHHMNSVEELSPNARDDDPRFRPGNLLLCARNANLLFILDRDSLDVVWHSELETIDFPHMPTLTPEGNILFFDNGYHRGWSRVVELDPVTQSIVWSYQADPREAFFSKKRGSSQRLSDGHTLILESQRGRAFEVTGEGEIVWEYWNPELRDGKRRRINRFLRIDAARLPALADPR